jgi:hypothetical protein
MTNGSLPERHIMLSVLFISSGGMVVAQALERDIAAQGRTYDEAKIAFERTLLGWLLLDQQHGRAPLSGIAAAPARYWDAWRVATAGRAQLIAEPVHGLDDVSIPAFMIPALTSVDVPADT